MKSRSVITFLFATVFSGTLLVGNIVPAHSAESSLQSGGDSTTNLSPAELKRQEKEEKRLQKEKLNAERKKKMGKEDKLEQRQGLTPSSVNSGGKSTLPQTPASTPVAPSKVKEEGKAQAKKSEALPAGDKMPHKPSGKHFSGNVSWYGPHFNGKKTASGEIFDMTKKTAAHRTLPFSTRVLVEDPKTGKTVVVKVNDRGPFVHSRVMDLSREGARQLGTLLHGTAYVDCMIVGGDTE